MFYTPGDIARFWMKVDKQGPQDCWPWKAATRNGGYGAFSVQRRKNRSTSRPIATAHRVSYEIAHGKKLRRGMLIMHICDNPGCVNPAHLKLADHATNSLDAALKGRMKTGPMKSRARSKIRIQHLKTLYNLLGTEQAVAEVLCLSHTRINQLLHGR